MSAEKFLVKAGGLAVDVAGVVSKIVEWCKFGFALIEPALQVHLESFLEF